MRALAPILVMCFLAWPAQGQYGGGSGTAEDPYLICTAEQLNIIGRHEEHWDKHFKLLVDIDVLDYAEAAFETIGHNRDEHAKPFTGVFDGNAHTISHFTYVAVDANEVGFFGYVCGHEAQIKDLRFVDPCVAGSMAVGSLVAYLVDGVITGCCAEDATISGDCDTGGLVGINTRGTLRNCHFSGHVFGANGTGGLLGGNLDGTIVDCSARAEVSGDRCTGGLVGWHSVAESGDIINCRSDGHVQGNEHVGGLVGFAAFISFLENLTEIRNCYSTSSVLAKDSVGGLVGRGDSCCFVTDCYSTGEVVGESHVGGLVGGHNKSHFVTSSFWDVETSGLTTSAGGTGKTTAQMQTAETFLEAGWDFVDEMDNGTDDLWQITEGRDYPRLWWEVGAHSPSPFDGAVGVLLPVILSWDRTPWSVKHDVYFAENEDAVAHATTETVDVYRGQQGASVTTYDPGILEFGKTYYWRIDEVAPTNPIGLWKGKVWRFTTIPFVWPIEDIVATSNAPFAEGAAPENTVNDSGLNDQDQHSTSTADMWLSTPDRIEGTYIEYQFDQVYKIHEMFLWNWNGQYEPLLGFGVKDMTVEYSQDGGDWTVLGDIVLDQAPGEDIYPYGKAVDFAGVTARYVRLIVRSSYGVTSQVGLSEVRFLHIPVRAHDPLPADGANDVAVDSLLTWRSGREAVWHEVHLSDDETTLGTESTLVERTQYSPVDPGPLNLATTYHWRVDEVNGAEAISIWDGDVWSFTTQEFLVVDHFESYDDEGDPIYETWLDGWSNDTQSLIVPWWGVLMEPPVHSGRESMPFCYVNDTPPYYAEVCRSWDAAQDWTIAGTEILTLYFHGQTRNTVDTLYVGIEDNAGHVAVVARPDGNTLLVAEWQRWDIPLADLQASGVDLTSIRKMIIGVGDRGDPRPGGYGEICIDDIRLYRSSSIER